MSSAGGIDGKIIEASVAMERPPSPSARMLGAIPLLLLYGLIAVVVYNAPKFEMMFKEMDLGSLPLVTHVTLGLAAFARSFYFLTVPALCLMAYAYFTWGCVTLRSLLRCALAISMLFLIGFVVAALAYELPMIAIMERIGK